VKILKEERPLCNKNYASGHDAHLRKNLGNYVKISKYGFFILSFGAYSVLYPVN
jgi:hypothetical protein